MSTPAATAGAGSVRTIVLVGATSGIGRAAAVRLAAEGHRMILIGRDPRRGAGLVEEIRRLAPPAGRAVFLAQDVSTLAGIEAVVGRIRDETDSVDTLMNNAGVMMPRRILTEEGFELNLAVHHLAPFTMTGLLLPLLSRGAGRIVNTNSAGHHTALFHSGPVSLDFADLQSEHGYDPYLAYSRSKLANLLFTFEFHRRYPGYSIAAIHPGMVRTRLVRSMHNPGFWLLSTATRWMLQPPASGGTAIAALATASAVHSGAYYDRFRQATPSPQALSRTDAARLWERTEQFRGPFAAGGDRMR